MSRTLRVWLLLGLGAALGAPVRAEGPAPGGCEPWPGEPTPLPGLADPDPTRARWAGLRVTELAALARWAESRSELEAHRLWTRVLCFDPDHAEARRGRGRMPLVRIHRPVPIALREELRAATALRDDPWQALGGPVHVRVRTPAPVPLTLPPEPEPGPAAEPEAPEPPTPDPALRKAERSLRLRETRQRLDTAEARVREARFREALRAVDRARSALAELDGEGEERALRVRAEVTAATAQIALGRRNAALESLARAIDADPGLELDPQTTSPRLLRALHVARSTRAAR